jgi:hypothetical protein
VQGGVGSDIGRPQRPVHSARHAVCCELGQGTARAAFRSCRTALALRSVARSLPLGRASAVK